MPEEFLKGLIQKIIANLVTPSFRRPAALLVTVLVLWAAYRPQDVLALPGLCKQNPHLAALGFVVAAVLLQLDALARFLDRTGYQWKISKWAGLARVFPIAPYPDLAQGHPYALDPARVRDAAEVALCGLLDADHATRVRLLLVSGWRMIGCEAAPGVLFKKLSGASKLPRLQVLLLNPEKEAAQRRADELGLTKEQYKSGVEAVLWTLRYWRDARGHSIEVYYYDEEPIWQMMITHHEIWLFCAAANIPAERSPIYCLRRDAEYGLAVGLRAVWQRRLGAAVKVDLGAIQSPVWKTLKDIDRRPAALPPST